MPGDGREPGRNWIYRLNLHRTDSTNLDTATQANLAGRKFILEKVRQEKKITHPPLQPGTGVRECYRTLDLPPVHVSPMRQPLGFFNYWLNRPRGDIPELESCRQRWCRCPMDYGVSQGFRQSCPSGSA